MSEPMMTCPTCGGGGAVALRDVLAAVYDLVRRNELSAIEVAAKLPDDVGASAINNRLESLRALELVTRRKVGRRWMYKAVR